MSSINLQESQFSGCETYIAIVVDESGSINQNEAKQIRDGLTSFINSQAQSNTTLSLIGMSNDDGNLRSDHIIQKKISSNQTDFLSWVNSFGSRQINPQSDYWASGIELINNLPVTPDIIVIVTDGLQVNNTSVLQNLYNDLSQQSRIFVYGVTGNDSVTFAELVKPLNFYLGRTAVLKTSTISAINSDYLRRGDFLTLGTELNQLTTDLVNAHIGCNAKVSIVENKLVYPVLTKGTLVNQETGSLVLKNKSLVDLTLVAGTKIHISAALNGLTLTLRDTVIIQAQSQLEVAIQINGTPLVNGDFSELIALQKVINHNKFTINFNVIKKPVVEISPKTSLQSTSLQITAAGSKGIDSTKGIHLRWLLAGELGEKHLPKGDLFTGEKSNFNKPDDFVKVYRAPYTKISSTLNLSLKPQSIDNSNALWVYKTANPARSFYVYFRNVEKYLSVKLSINPLTNPTGFIQAYGNNVIEIENKNELFFAAELNFNSVSSSSIVRLETLSVAENTITAAKRVTNRKTYSSTQINAVRLVAENGRSIRFKASNCMLNGINFEFYSDFIQHANDNGNWDLKGKYALSENDTTVFEQLEPQLNAVHGKWLKYNDGEYVNINNYKDKWQRATVDGDKNIKEVLKSYIELSEIPDNPTALETINFGDTVEGTPNTSEISNLDLLNIAANDYHIARMLGLGCIDIDSTILSGEFVYLTEYTTFKDLKGGLEPVEVQHLSMSIPTSVATERMSLPVQLSKIVPGLNIDSEEDETAKITDPNGYSFDGKKRYVSLFMDDIKDYDIDTDFFSSSLEYDGSTFTFPIYVGVDYKIKNIDPTWVKPELAYDSDYYNVNKDLERSSYEPAPIIIPETGKSILNIRQEKTGKNTYVYQGYGINIFSRATSGRQISIESDIKPTNTLMPPSGINTLLITPENPLMFTSKMEQDRLKKITGTDKTFIRILYDYYSIQELLSYSIPTGMTQEDAEKPNTIYPDNEEIFADYFKLYYRDGLPQIEYAQITNIQNNTENDITSIIKIKDYTVLSSGEKINVTLNTTNKDRFIGGILTIGDQNYVIDKVAVFNDSLGKFDYANVHVLKKEVSDSVLAEGEATVDSEQIKAIKMPENGLCALVENMLTPSNWHQPGPLNFQVEYPTNLKAVHRETIQPKDSQGSGDIQIEKTRGIWKPATIERALEDAYQMDVNGKYVLDVNENPIRLPEKKHLGLYKLTFSGYNLPQHPQYKGENVENSVEWSNGTVRLFTKSSVEPGNTVPVKSRKEFKVVLTENIGGTGNLVLYINDTSFKLKEGGNYIMDPAHDEIIIGEQKANYYPSYKVSLFANPAYGLTSANILPREDESTHYSIFGISSHSNLFNYDSKISVPSPMYAVKIEEPVKPEEVEGGLYATRPDFFNRSTFTLTSKYTHKPYGVLHYRANDEALLSVLYKRTTINTIREELKKLGGNDEIYFANRWKNFLNFNDLETQANYGTFPLVGEPDKKYHFPIPDNEQLKDAINDFIKWHNKSQGKTVPEIDRLTALNQLLISTDQGVEKNLLAIHFIEQAIHTAFVPLTEVPVIYDYINDNSYVPINKKQTIKDKNGHTLKPTDPDFDIAPMMKITNAAQNRTQFTDFNLDGNSQNVYFYGVREMDIKMNFSEFSAFWGPVKLVPSNPPQTPEIKRIMPVLENPVLGIKPAIQIELNAYQPEYKIKKINIYRATSMLNAQSIRTMSPVKEILIGEDTLSTDFDNTWTVYDEFQDLENIPFGDGLFYRITVSREIEYADPSSTDLNPVVNIDYTPSQPSKITATVIADAILPQSPVIKATGAPTGTNGAILKPVIFNWEKTTHNGKYHLYKMNNQGNWDKIHEVVSNNETITLPLQQTKLTTDELIIKTEDGERVYHHFKVVSENSSGMYSSEEKILTL
ncbi:VWA domain-containing protein [Flavobacterium sp. LS1R49]|uniref:VWA domain-containing protein n=1 Tax=Flavobacterium shii TaxID=2987687 RepID=A0A9X3BY24_9FLAO|nr:VWA domain-containing protein [Flavobacterium shii]MCV9928120.1 VWA domain-containing protein [Flavobacterium shii]